MNASSSGKRLILFTSLPKVGGHAAITAGLCRLVARRFREVEIWCKPMPDHGHSTLLQEELEAEGCRFRMLADAHGHVDPAAIARGVVAARAAKSETVFVTIAMRHLSPVLSSAIGPSRSLYYHITHSVDPGNIRRLRLYSHFFSTILFICPATYRAFPDPKPTGKFSWVPQASEMSVSDLAGILRAKEGGSTGRWRFGFLGRLTAEKGAEVMAGFADACETPCELHVAGAGPCEGLFSQRAGRPGVCRVIWHGAYDPVSRRDFLRRFFSGIDLLVVPSQDDWETLSMVTLEALQHGTPVLVSAAGGLVSFAMPELGPAPQEAIEMVQPGAIGRRLEEIATTPVPDPHERGRICQTHYKNHFSDSRILCRWESLLGLESSCQPE